MSNDKTDAASPAAPGTPPAAARPKAAARGGRGKWILAALIAVAVGGYSIYWKQRTTAPPPDPLADVASPPADTAPPLPDAAPMGEPAPEPMPAPLPEPVVAEPAAPVLAPPDSTPAAPALEARVAELEASLAALAHTPAQPAAVALVVDEVSALVSLAEQRLALARDVNGAASALRVAASRLTGGEFLAQRRAVMADLAALESFREVDVATLSAELADLARQAAGYTIKGPAPIVADAPAATVDGWRGLALAVWTSLRGLVEVREADETRDPLLNPAYAALARQQLALDVSAARIALLQRDAAGWRAALEPAIAEMESHFDPADTAVTATLRRLREIAALDIAPVLPSLARSVDALAVAPLTPVHVAPPPVAAPSASAPSPDVMPAPGPSEETAL